MMFSNALEIIKYTHEAGIYLKAQNDQLIVDAPVGCVSNELKTCLKLHKEQLLEVLKYHGYSLKQLEQESGKYWNTIKDEPEALVIYAEMLKEQADLKAGNIPTSFTATTYCGSCKTNVLIPPALSNGGLVFGCPLCHYRRTIH